MLSIVIPAVNEEQALPATLAQVLSQQGRYEIIVVDGGSTDRTCEIARTCPRVQLIHARKGRARQMNAGAQVARGEWLLFLHADTLLPDGTIQQLNALGTDIGCDAGGFRHAFSGNDWRLRFISFLDNRRCEKTRIIYGDQAMFVRRTLFEDLGGFPEQQVMEDIAFCEKLVKVTWPVLLDIAVTTSARKFMQMGIWRSLYRIIIIQTRHELGLPVSNKYPFFSDIR